MTDLFEQVLHGFNVFTLGYFVVLQLTYTVLAVIGWRAIEDYVERRPMRDYQAVAESVGHFHAQMERARSLLLGMLGHDMRNPLSAIVSTASYLAALNAGEQVSAAAARLIRSGAAMRALLDDLVDFNRTRLGLGINVVPSDIDLAAAVADEVEQLRAAHPRRKIELTVTGIILKRSARDYSLLLYLYQISMVLPAN